MKRIFTYLLLALTAVACHMETPQKPIARFTYSPEGGCYGECEFTFTSISENAESFEWDFGDGPERGNEQVAKHTFKAAGTYRVSLIARGVDGGTSGSTQTIHIDNVKPFSLTGDKNIPTDILSDDNGNIYVSGTASGTVKFDDSHILKSKGGDDFFVAKFDSTGKCIWLYTDGSAGDDHGNAIALDKQNNVYLTGFVGGKVVSWNNIPRGGVDGFVTKIKSDGALAWSKTFGGPKNDQGRSLAFYQAGEGETIYLVGRVDGDNQNKTIDFNRTSFQQAGENEGFFVLVKASTGIFDEPIMIGGDDVQIPEAITVDLLGNAYIAGFFLNTVSLPGLQPLKSVNDIDAFVAKWSPIRGFQWLRRVGSGGNDFAYDIAVDLLGNVYMTGMYNGTIEEFPLKSKGDENVYLLKWNADGQIQNGANGFIDDIKDYTGGIALTPKGNVVIAGSFTNSAQFPTGKNTSVSSLGGTDIIVTEVDPNTLDRTGDFVAKSGGILEDRVNKICVTKSGYVYAAGWFYGSPTYKGVPLNGKDNVENTFIVRYKL